MSNPSPSRMAANARRQEIVTEKIEAARQWLNSPILGYETLTRRLILVVSSNIVRYADEYAKLNAIHPRTARKYLEAALNNIKPARKDTK